MCILPYNPYCPFVGWSVAVGGYDFLKWRGKLHFYAPYEDLVLKRILTALDCGNDIFSLRNKMVT